VKSGLPDSSQVICLGKMGTNLYASVAYDKITKDALYLSTDNGASWNLLFDSIRGEPMRRIEAITVSGDSLFLGTDYAIYLTTNEGLSFSNVDSNLSTYPLNSLAVIDSFLYAGLIGTWNYRCSLLELNGTAGVAPLSPIQILLSSYPNPFSQSTTIDFTSPESGVAEVSVVNLLGEKVAQVFSGELEAGEHSFTWDASGMAPGMYECILRMNGSVELIPIVLSR